MSPSDIAAWASLAIALIALGVAVWAVKRGDDNSSGALVLATYESFRVAWLRTLEADANRIEYEIRELLNLIEIACAIHSQGSIHGQLARLLEDYISRALTLIAGRPILCELVPVIVQQEPARFQYIVTFIHQRPKLRAELAAAGLRPLKS